MHPASRAIAGQVAEKAMRVVVFGASGATGRQLLGHALGDGHQVTAFVRHASRLDTRSPQLTVVVGDVSETAVVASAVAAQDGVLCALGAATPLHRDRILVEGVRHIVDAMERTGVRRFVYLSFLGVREGRHQLSLVGRYLVAPVLLRNVVADHEAKERIIRQSTLDWVIVRPPRLTNGVPRGHYRSGLDIRATSVIPRISRADVAEFMLHQLSDDTYVRKAPAVMY
jgi:putative NADH-flavin reductase